MSLLNTRILKEKIVNESAIFDNSYEYMDNNEDIDIPVDDIITESAIEDVEDVIPERTMSLLELADFEEKIEDNNDELYECVVDSYNEVGRLLNECTNSWNLITSNAIHEQYNILTESAYGTELYNEKMTVLMESTAGNIVKTITNIIAKVIQAATDLFRNISLKITLHFKDYEKFVLENQKELLQDAAKYGSSINVKLHDWDKDMFEKIDANKLNNIIPRDTAGLEDATRDGETQDELNTRTYINTLKALDIDVKSSTMNEIKDELKNRYLLNEYSVAMTEDNTKKCIDKLKEYNTKTKAFLISLRKAISPELSKFTSTLKKECKGPDDTMAATAHINYCKRRLATITTLQNAVNDVAREKTRAILAYGKENYSALKALKKYTKPEKKPMNDSVDLDYRKITEFTLHA